MLGSDPISLVKIRCGGITMGQTVAMSLMRYDWIGQDVMGCDWMCYVALRSDKMRFDKI